MTLLERETARYLAEIAPPAGDQAALAAHWWRGVPFHWMRDWAGPVPMIVSHGAGASVTDVRGNVFDDFCLGDTPSMYGHAPAPVVRAVSGQIAKGGAFMLPTPDAAVVGKLLAERFGLPIWQMTVTATDANRAAIRWARAITGRTKILVFDGCYHGAADDTYVNLNGLRPGLIGQVYDVSEHSRAIPFNDLAALEAALADKRIACVLAEPALTNCGMVLPDPGFHDALRRLTRAAGTLLIIDETHTISTGPGGYTRAFGLEPDMFTIGKPVAGGIPTGLLGVTQAVAEAMERAAAQAGPGYSGMGATLSGNALAMAAMRAMLEEVMTPAAYAHMERLAARLAAGLESLVARHGLPWSVVRVGARLELVFAAPAPRDAQAMRPCLADPLLHLFHLFLLNRRILIAPFHNMMLLSPATDETQVDRLLAAVDEFAALVKADQ